jgi:hypothetical protein
VLWWRRKGVDKDLLTAHQLATCLFRSEYCSHCQS